MQSQQNVVQNVIFFRKNCDTAPIYLSCCIQVTWPFVSSSCSIYRESCNGGFLNNSVLRDWARLLLVCIRASRREKQTEIYGGNWARKVCWHELLRQSIWFDKQLFVYCWRVDLYTITKSGANRSLIKETINRGMNVSGVLCLLVHGLVDLIHYRPWQWEEMLCFVACFGWV